MLRSRESSFLHGRDKGIYLNDDEGDPDEREVRMQVTGVK